MASSLCLDSIIPDAKSEVSPCLSTGEGIKKKKFRKSPSNTKNQNHFSREIFDGKIP